ncbi:hypothetical protein SDC9_95104 [bioreactor metagenome]|uniref:Uncharacterized protein n=1 Tax=bioreactor metagenome TaxID=1076179 RepID=A0A645A5A6_9ZZZZ
MEFLAVRQFLHQHRFDDCLQGVDFDALQRHGGLCGCETGFSRKKSVFRYRPDTDDDPCADLSDAAIFVGPESGSFELNPGFGYPGHRLRFRDLPVAPVLHKIA